MEKEVNLAELNNMTLSFYIPGDRPVFEIHCASFELMPRGLAYDAEGPAIMVHFDWEDEKRSGAPEAIKRALWITSHSWDPLCDIKVQKLGSNSILIENYSRYNIKMNSYNSAAKF